MDEILAQGGDLPYYAINGMAEVMISCQFFARSKVLKQSPD
ncbi:MAG: hypothetical protein ACOY32_10060 [Thermodesulfobacteriota bacterium]